MSESKKMVDGGTEWGPPGAPGSGLRQDGFVTKEQVAAYHEKLDEEEALIKKALKGIKYDGEKPRMYLIPPKSELELAKVLTFGAMKYSEDNWRKLDNLQNRYMGGALRHLNAVRQGEENDEESGFHHLAHALCCIMFMLEDRLLTKSSAALNELISNDSELY